MSCFYLVTTEQLVLCRMIPNVPMSPQKKGKESLPSGSNSRKCFLFPFVTMESMDLVKVRGDSLWHPEPVLTLFTRLAGDCEK